MHEIVIICDSLWHVGRVKSAIVENLSQPGTQSSLVRMSWDELTLGLIQSIQIVMTVFERTKEFGTLMAIGATPWRLSRVLILESGFLTLCGIILGILAGCILTLWLGHTGIPMGEAEGMIRGNTVFPV